MPVRIKVTAINILLTFARLIMVDVVLRSCIDHIYCMCNICVYQIERIAYLLFVYSGDESCEADESSLYE